MCNARTEKTKESGVRISEEIEMIEWSTGKKNEYMQFLARQKAMSQIAWMIGRGGY